MGAAFAADDNNATLGETDEIAVEESINSLEVTEVDGDVIAEDAAETLAVNAGANEEIISNSTQVETSNVVTKENFHNYFDDSGSLLGNVTCGELIFNGDFSGIDVNYITIDKPIKFTGNDAVFTGVSFLIGSDNVVVDGFTLTQSDVWLFDIEGTNNVTLSNNILNFNAIEGYDGYAVLANEVSALSLINNTIIYVGTTDGTVRNNAIRISGNEDDELPATDILVQGNKFNIRLPSVDVYYDPYTYEPTIQSEGIAFYYCDGVDFIDNNVFVWHTENGSGFYDTIYGVGFRGNPYNFDADEPIMCYNVVVANNEISASGLNFMYALCISADGFEIYNNTIDANSLNNYANAITVDGPSCDGEIYNNQINVLAPEIAYGIYSYQYMGAIEDITYTNNTITANAYTACGMEIVECNPVILDNTITATGNYTCGIVASIRDEGTISGNTIKSVGSNVGSAATGDPLLPKNSMGLSVKGSTLIENNVIESSDYGVKLIDSEGMTLNNNNITVNTAGNVESYGIYALGVSDLEILKNNIIYVGNTNGTVVNNAIRISGDENKEEIASDITVEGNTFDIKIPSVPVYYDPDTWESSVMSEGIVFYYCEDVEFENNNVLLNYNNASGAYDTIYVVSVRGNPYNFDAEDPIACANVTIVNNKITAGGHGYIYGIFAAAKNLEITKNDLIIVSDDYYANGIDVEGPSNGVVSDNDVLVISPGTAYGIYASYYNGAVENMTYDNNTVFVQAYAACGMELLEINPVVSNNEITAEGNYTYGIVASIRDNGTISGNTIKSVGSNVGSAATGDPLLPKNSMGLSVKGSTLIEDNVIESSDYGVKLIDSEGMTLNNNNITVNTAGNVESYGIYALGVSDLEILKNNIIYVGNTDGTVVNNAIRISGNEDKEEIASGIIVDGNTFDIKIPSVPVYYDPDTWESSVMSEGIVFYYCEDVEFENNNIALDYNNASGMYDTIYVVAVRGNPYNFDADDPIACANVDIVNNTINAKGHGYIYGIRAAAKNLDVSENTLSIVADDYYACGIDIEGTSNGDVNDNDVFVISPGTAYGIYSSNYDGAVKDMTYDHNTVSVDAYAACGMELLEANPVVSNNEIIATGNYTYGIVASIVDNTTIENNTIACDGSEVGDAGTGDSLLPKNSIGISVKGNALVKDNVVDSTNIGVSTYKANLTAEGNTIKADGDYAIVLDDYSNATVTDNYLSGKNGVGDRAITGGNAVDVSGNGPDLKAILIGVDVNKVYGDGQQFIATLVDENGNPIANKTISVSIGDINMTGVTDEKGVAKFDLDLAGGNYTIISSYAGDDVYGPRFTQNTVVVNTKATNIVSTKTVSVLLTAIKKGYYYQITLKDNDGNVLANKKVTITFNGKNYTRTTDANGLIKFKLASTKVGTKKLTIKFAGDENYTAVTKTATIKMLKEATKFVVPATAFKVNVKTKVLKVTLRDSKNKGVGGVQVTLRVNGVTYSAKTVSTGVAAIKITKLTKVGSFATLIKFAGNNYYKAASKSMKIVVKK